MTNVIAGLIKLGSSSRYTNTPVSATENLIKNDEYWLEVGGRLNQQELDFLIRGLIYTGKLSGQGIGGSVTPVRWLFSLYANKYPKSEGVLCEWIVKNRINPYDPFGTIVFNTSKSLQEHNRRLEEKRSRAIENERLEMLRQGKQ